MAEELIVLTDISNFDVKYLIPYDVNNGRISSLSSGRKCSFYKASFMETCGNQPLVIAVNVTLGGLIVDVVRASISVGIYSLGITSVYKHMYRMLTGLSMRFWFPQFNFRRFVYRYARNLYLESRLRSCFDGHI